ncbi:MAG: hypothetical protein AAF961_19655, partial [Planctomycetota bacterium]
MLMPNVRPTHAPRPERSPFRWKIARSAALICSVGLWGCRGVDNVQVDVLERDLRQQEDYIYELEDYLVEYSEKLRACRCDKQKQSASVKPKA